MKPIQLSEQAIQGELFEGLVLGSNLKEMPFADSIYCHQEQEGDIPGLYSIRGHPVNLDLFVLDSILYGVDIKPEENPDCQFILPSGKGKELQLDNSPENLIEFLNLNQLKWEFDRKENLPNGLCVKLESKVNFFYHFEDPNPVFFRLQIFDWEAYRNYPSNQG